MRCLLAAILKFAISRCKSKAWYRAGTVQGSVHSRKIRVAPKHVCQDWIQLVPRFSLLPVDRPWLGLVTWSQNKINYEGGVLCLSILFVSFVFTVHAMIERARQIC